MPKKAKKIDYAAIARRRKADTSKVNRRPQDQIEADMRSGALVEEGIEAIKKYGKTEFGQRLRWSNWFEELMRLVLDLRVAEVFTSGGAQISKTFSNALAASFFAQYVGIRVGWCFPLDKLLDLHVPTQHKPLLEQWSKLGGAVQSKSSSTANRLYDLGIGRSIFTSISSNKTGGASAGTNIVSFTADVAFLEEASQCNWSDMAPVKSRVEQSISPVYPLRYLGTPGGGTGIELQAEDAEYEFWPHCKCVHCFEEVNLDPRDTLLVKNYFRLPNGQLEARYLSTTGLPIEWNKDDEGTAMFACPHCGEELDDHERQTESYFKCVKTGTTLRDFITDVITENWETKRYSASLWLSPLLRHKPGKVVAQNIIDNGLNPDSASDWCEQQLGIPSTAMATSITNEHLLAALNTTPFQGGEKVRIMGIDQGRDSWWCTLCEVWWKYEGTHISIYNNARFNFLDARRIPWTEAQDLADEWDVECIMMDAKPTIYLAAQFCEQTGAKMSEQIDKLGDSYKDAMIQDGGEVWPCFKIRNNKFGRSVIDIFASGRVHLDPKFRSHMQDRSTNSLVRHLKGPWWDSDEERIQRASDKIDDYWFSLLFIMACFDIYLFNEGKVSRSSGWGWWT